MRVTVGLGFLSPPCQESHDVDVDGILLLSLGSALVDFYIFC